MENSQAGRVYTGKIKQPKKSILRRWSIANAIFFFAAFIFFALIVFQIVLNSILAGDKSAMTASMNAVSVQLSKADTALSTQNLNQYFNYRSSHVDTESGQLVQTSNIVSNLIGSNNNHFFIFDQQKNLIFTTAQTSSVTLHEDTKGRIITLRKGNAVGFLESKPIKSTKTGQVIGYLQTYYDLTAYFNLRDHLILSLIAVAIIVTLAAIIFGYMMADHFLRPLRKISNSMQKVAASPDEAFEPVVIRQDDEIKQIGDFYNTMMARINVNIDLQRHFVSDVSHELRTPLAVIDGNLKMLTRWGFDDKELVEENVRISAEEAGRMKELLTDMMSLSRLEQLTAEYQTASCDPAEVTALAVHNFKSIHEDFEIKFYNQLDTAELAQISDNHYRQALTILMDNAAKYSPTDRRYIAITLKEDEEFISTSVADRGLGISADDVEHVFERFYRADKARNREIGGTGLGLAIIANIMKQYKGEITVTSTVDIGSTFTFKIPKAEI